MRSPSSRASRGLVRSGRSSLAESTPAVGHVLSGWCPLELHSRFLAGGGRVPLSDVGELEHVQNSKCCVVRAWGCRDEFFSSRLLELSHRLRDESDAKVVAPMLWIEPDEQSGFIILKRIVTDDRSEEVVHDSYAPELLASGD